MIRFGTNQIHLINIAIIPKYQKQEMGTMLLNHFLNLIPPKTSVFLEVERSNFSPHQFLFKIRF